MKKRTRAPVRAPAAKRRRKVAGTRGKATPSRQASGKTAKAKGSTRSRREAGKKDQSGNPRTASKSATKAARDRAAGVERAERTIRRLKAELTELRRQVAELRASAETDFLLRVLNRRGFERELNRSIAYIKRYRATGALVVLDVDRLKPINDTFGHAAGDEVLKAIAATLAAMVRASDVVGRLGGDEFAVLLWNLGEADARAKAQALEQAIDRLHFRFGGQTATTGASAGIAILGPQADVQAVLEEADSAMYVRKAQRRHETIAAEG